MSWKEKIAYRMLETRLAGVQRETKMTCLNTAQKIGVLWHIDDIEAFQFITDYLRNTKSIIRKLCFTGKKAVTNEYSSTFSKKDLSWLGFPESGAVTTFIDLDFDILLNISTVRLFPLDAVMALSKASFKIGWSPREPNHLDLNIDINKNIDSLYLVKQQIYYLDQLNNSSRK
jgi:hypothetical protein